MKPLLENWKDYIKEGFEDVVPSSALGQTRRELEHRGIEAKEETFEGGTLFGRPLIITQLTFQERDGRTTKLSFRGTSDKAFLIDVKTTPRS